MEETVKRSNKKRTKKYKKLKLFALVILLIPLGLLGYGYFQYYDAKTKAESALGSAHKKEEIEFNGEKHEQDKVHILLIGVDKRKGQVQSNSDTIMIAQFDPKNQKVKLATLMRDMYVPIPGYSDSYKINAANFLGGPELVRKTIKENFGINTEYFVMVDFKGFETIIDTLNPDGIEIDVEKSMSKGIGVSLVEGTQKLNGKELLGYARYRQDSESDFGRTRRQQQVIKVLLDEVVSTNGISNAPRLLGAVQPYISTNISSVDSLSLIKEVLSNRPESVDTLTIPVQGSYTDERVEGKNGGHSQLVLQIDEAVNRQALHDFLLNESDDKVAQSH